MLLVFQVSIKKKKQTYKLLKHLNRGNEWHPTGDGFPVRVTFIGNWAGNINFKLSPAKCYKQIKAHLHIIKVMRESYDSIRGKSNEMHPPNMLMKLTTLALAEIFSMTNPILIMRKLKTYSTSRMIILNSMNFTRGRQRERD